MANKMLIDATHPEETRVVVVRGNRVEEFDYESATRQQLRGNIYLARVTRVEPSLQAAFVDYGGNRHGFLAFSEIHPDYYQIPVADREALLAEEAASASRDGDFDDDMSNGDAGASEDKPSKRRRSRRGKAKSRADSSDSVSEEVSADSDAPGARSETASEDETDDTAAAVDAAETDLSETNAPDAADGTDISVTTESDDTEATADAEDAAVSDDVIVDETGADDASVDASADDDGGDTDGDEEGAATAESDDGANGQAASDDDDVESVGSEDALEEVPVRRARSRRSYKIQEVIKRRQVMLVQVVKEERGNKGAALTTYLSLAGRYCVLMPNTARGGGISRKITNASDRKRLKDVAKSLEVPNGMGLILRTAGASRTKTEVKRDYEYLLRLWESVRERTLASTAPTLVYEEGSLVKRAIRDLYNKEIDQVLVSGDDAYREGKDFMRMLMPSHAKNVQPYKEDDPIFTRYSVEGQLDAMFNPEVTLKSGGYIVINQTEALVSIDVNSGRATREHSIEDTAVKTNLEAAEEVARQLRLRDLAGLIVIDFIDMDESRNNRAVERKLKDCLKTDRARIQVGRISHFGLLEMSRQRLRPGLLEGSLQVCSHCQGTGMVRSTESVALHVIRTLEDELMRRPADLVAKTTTTAALYILNNKRDHLVALETRFGVSITVAAEEDLGGVPCLIERGDPRKVQSKKADAPITPISDDMADEDDGETADGARETSDRSEDGSGRRKRRRRGRRGGSDRDEQVEATEADAEARSDTDESQDDAGGEDNGSRRKRRRGRRGGRRRGERATETSLEADGEVMADGESVADAAAMDAPEADSSDTDQPEASPSETDPSRTVAANDMVETVTASAEDTETSQSDDIPTVDEPAPASVVDEADLTPSSVEADKAEADIQAPEIATEPVNVVEVTPPQPAPVEEAPAGPPRKGWWQRRILGR